MIMLRAVLWIYNMWARFFLLYEYTQHDYHPMSYEMTRTSKYRGLLFNFILHFLYLGDQKNILDTTYPVAQGLPSHIPHNRPIKNFKW